MLDVVVDSAVRLPHYALHSRQEPIWLPAGLLAVLMTLTMAIGAFGGEITTTSAEPLEWRSVTAKRPTVGAAKNATVKNLPAKRYFRDPNVTATAHGESRYGSPFGQSSSGRASSKSIVVKSSRVNDPSLRVAQSDTKTAEEDFGAELEKALSAPIGVDAGPSPLDPTGEDSLTEPGAGMGELPAPDSGGELPPLNGGTLDAGPSTDLPPLDPPADPPKPDPFDPTAPSPQLGIDPLSPDPLDVGPEPLDDPPADDDSRWAKQKTEAQRDCAEELAELKANRLSMLDIRIGVAGEEGRDYPFECSIDDGTPFTPRAWPQVTYMWKASALCHKPLYFEQPHLERYGHSWGPYLDPLVAGAHFFTRFPALPYCMGLKAPNECVYTLGYYRPGNCAPYLIEQPGVTGRAVANTIGAWTGGVFLIP